METAAIRQHQKLLERTNWFQRLFPLSKRPKSRWPREGMFRGDCWLHSDSDTLRLHPCTDSRCSWIPSTLRNPNPQCVHVS